MVLPDRTFTIATWNVNSIRARLSATLAWMEKRQPDLLCLQETKVEDEQFPTEAFAAVGYRAAFYGQKSYNGVAMISKSPLDDMRMGFGDAKLDTQKRLMTACIFGVRVVNVYIPNGESPDSEKFVWKLEWIRRLRAHLEDIAAPTDRVVIVGDFNVAPEAIDTHAPEEAAADVLFHPQSRMAIANLAQWGFEDLFRLNHPEVRQYSWWDYRAAAFRRNLGARIDHIWGTPAAAAQCRACEIDPTPRAGERPSDHAPVIATLARV